MPPDATLDPAPAPDPTPATEPAPAGPKPGEWTYGLGPEERDLVEARGWQSPTDAVRAFRDAQPKPWTDGLDPDLARMVEVKKWKEPADVVRALAAAQKFISKPVDELVHMPANGMTPEHRLEVLRRLGAPENAEGYDFGEIAPAEGETDLITPFRAKAAELGIPASEAKSLAEWYVGLGAEQNQAAEAQVVANRDAAVTSLRSEWGQAFDAKIQAGQQALMTLGLSEDAQVMLEQAMTPKVFAQVFADLGGRLGEFKIVEAYGAGDHTAESALAEAGTLMADPAYIDKMHPGHKALLAKVAKLMEAAHGTEPGIPGTIIG